MKKLYILKLLLIIMNLVFAVMSFGTCFETVGHTVMRAEFLETYELFVNL